MPAVKCLPVEEMTMTRALAFSLMSFTIAGSSFQNARTMLFMASALLERWNQGARARKEKTSVSMPPALVEAFAMARAITDRHAPGDAQAVLAKQKETGLTCMVGHTRRFNPSHQYVHNKIKAGEFNIQQMDVQTYFFRRTNMNALGQPRSWTDHLLWHHAAHTVDLFAYQAGSPIVKANAVQGPIHPTLGIAMDMSIQLKAANGAICTLSLSFNNDGPLGTFFRYIGDSATYIARYDDLFNGKDEKIDVSKVDVSMNGIELQDREFFAAIREGREPNSSVHQVLDCYRVLHDLEQQLEAA